MKRHDFIADVTDFVFVQDVPEKADAIFIPGSPLDNSTYLAAELYHAGYAPAVIPSGHGPINGEMPETSEWQRMHDVLCRSGVPDSAILREDKATFTWENALFSRRLTDEAGINIRKGILCCRPFHARRALFYYQTAYPGTEWIMCPAREPGFQRDDWYRTKEGRERILGEMRRLGDQIKNEFELMIGGESNGHT